MGAQEGEDRIAFLAGRDENGCSRAFGGGGAGCCAGEGLGGWLNDFRSVADCCGWGFVEALWCGLYYALGGGLGYAWGSGVGGFKGGEEVCVCAEVVVGHGWVGEGGGEVGNVVFEV